MIKIATRSRGAKFSTLIRPTDGYPIVMWGNFRGPLLNATPEKVPENT